MDVKTVTGGLVLACVSKSRLGGSWKDLVKVQGDNSDLKGRVLQRSPNLLVDTKCTRYLHMSCLSVSGKTSGHL